MLPWETGATLTKSGTLFMKLKFRHGAASAALLSMIAPGAWAQTAPAVAAANVSQMAGALETVVVSAEKRETDLQKTPIAIAVANDDFLQQRHVDSLIDLASGS